MEAFDADQTRDSRRSVSIGDVNIGVKEAANEVHSVQSYTKQGLRPEILACIEMCNKSDGRTHTRPNSTL